MLYHASATIAAEHPELANQIRSIDEFLFKRQGQVFRLSPAADMIGVDSKELVRLLKLYEKHKIVEKIKVAICPEDNEILELDVNGNLICDICDSNYMIDECEEEVVYHSLQASPPKVVINEPQFTNGYALLIGVGEYINLNKLGKTRTDANDLYQLIINPMRAGYPQENVALLLDHDATKAAINDKLDWLARSTGPDDTVIIFFSGHGAQRVGGFEPGEYLCPVEADWYKLHSTAISTNELTTAIRSIPAGRIAVILDACHSGGIGEPKDIGSQVKAGLSDNAFNRLSEGHGRAIIASCHPNEVSWELPKMRNGLFTHFVLKALEGAARSDDGAVHIFDLFDYVSQNVPLYKKDQHPLFKAQTGHNFAVALVPQSINASPPELSGSVIEEATSIDKIDVSEISLEGLLEELSKIKKVHYYHPDFQSWHFTVKLALREVFGSDSYLVTEYDKVAWHTSDMPEDEAEQNNLYSRSCVAAEGILKAAIRMRKKGT
jgi:hypothetical protein